MRRRRPDEPSFVQKDGRDWLLASQSDVVWINSGTEPGLTVTSAVPPEFADYATIVVPDQDVGRGEDIRLLLRLLAEQSSDERWWLGYLDTGADDVVFVDAPRVSLYSGWRYVLVQAGFDQAVTWRRDASSWRAPGPDLVFPHDRSWLLSWLWDDDWRCLGGTDRLVDRVLQETRLAARRVQLGEDATPPGHVAR